MDGVTILSEISCRGAELWQVIVGWFVSVVMSCFMLCSILDLWNDGYKYYIVKSILTIVALFVALIFLITAICVTGNYRTFHTEYTVAIDDTVGFNEFYNHYEIISQDDNTYTVKEIDE